MKNSSMMTAIRSRINRFYHRIGFFFGKKVVLLNEIDLGIRYAFFHQIDTNWEGKPYGYTKTWGKMVHCFHSGRFEDNNAYYRGNWRLIKTWLPVKEFNLKAKNAVRSS